MSEPVKKYQTRTWDLGSDAMSLTLPARPTLKHVEKMRRYFELLAEEVAISWEGEPPAAEDVKP